ncbi:DUF7848 domain-containing protein [Streptomyces sp. BBFR102]|uniref:DUF7848 domain-containing protein n=1 Tax=Streptomyces sp. BBFR102 TaxID=3448171 RepID=UPI003F530F4E
MSKHRITQQPDTEVTFAAKCLMCAWAAEPASDGATVDVACMSHTDRTGHARFRRLCTPVALVERAEMTYGSMAKEWRGLRLCARHGLKRTAFWYDPDGKQRQKTFETKKRADDQRKCKEQELDAAT